MFLTPNFVEVGPNPTRRRFWVFGRIQTQRDQVQDGPAGTPTRTRTPVGSGSGVGVYAYRRVRIYPLLNSLQVFFHVCTSLTSITRRAIFCCPGGWTPKGVGFRVIGPGPGPAPRPEGPNPSDPSRVPPFDITPLCLNSEYV